MNCANIAKKASDSWYVSNILGETTDIGLRISFKESGVKFTLWIRRFFHWWPSGGGEIQVLKFEPVMLGPKGGGGGINIPRKEILHLAQILHQ